MVSEKCLWRNERSRLTGSSCVSERPKSALEDTLQSLPAKTARHGPKPSAVHFDHWQRGDQMTTRVTGRSTTKRREKRKNTIGKVIPDSNGSTDNSLGKPIWEVVAELGAQIPDEEWSKWPSDGSTNYKHYLYGRPKK